jgi:hypothetical protein
LIFLFSITAIPIMATPFLISHDPSSSPASDSGLSLSLSETRDLDQYAAEVGDLLERKSGVGGGGGGGVVPQSKRVLYFRGYNSPQSF